MNALLVYPRIPPSFWEWSFVVSFRNVKALGPPLGLLTVSALLPRHWKQRLVDLNIHELTESDWNWADVILVSSMIVQREGMLDLIKEGKRRQKIVVVGGPYPTSCPDEVLNAGPDYLVQGEAEVNIRMVISAIEDGTSPRVFSERPISQKIESPIPNYALASQRDYFGTSIQTTRGCPFRCEFCDIRNLYGSKIRHKEPDQVILEVDAIYEMGWRGDVFVADDNFIGDREYAKEVLNKLIAWTTKREHPFVFMCQASLNLGKDDELMELMIQANFFTVFVGVESPDEHVLALNRKFHNFRNPITECLDNMRDRGLTVMPSFVLGFDGEKKGLGDRLISMIETTSIPVAMVNLLQILPGTDLASRMKAEGRLIERRTVGDFTGGTLSYVPDRPATEIHDEYLKVHEYIYNPANYLTRVRHYFSKMAPTRRAMARKNGEQLPPDGYARSLPLYYTLRGLLILIWRQGIRSRHRAFFWRHTLGIIKDNPSRLRSFLDYCALGEDMFALVEIIRGRMRAHPTSAYVARCMA